MFYRMMMAAFATAVLIASTGCACRKSCFSSSSSYAPPCACTSADPLPPPQPGLVPIR